jgi:AI-2 transport protein TqsA
MCHRLPDQVRREIGNADVPRYAVTLTGLYGRLLAWLANYRITLPEPTAEVLMNPTRVVNVATVFLRGFAGFMTLVFLVAIVTLFLLAEAVGVPRKVRAAFGEDASMRRYGRIMAEIQRYLAFKTATSIATGILIGLWALLIGLDFPLFWGLLAFLLNYIPNIGSIIAAVPAVLVALLQLGFGGALALGAVYLGVNMLIGNLIEPAVLGRRLGLSTLVVILSLIFWGWVWGAVGMFLSVPIMMAARIALSHSRDYRWIAVLMAGHPKEEAEEPPAALAAPGADVA